jgi:DNA replication protein DnaC
MNELKNKLRELKLAGAVKTLETRNKYALEHKASYLEFLELIIEDEYANRMANSYHKRFSKAKLTMQKTLDNYDFSYQPELDKKLINELASCRFILEKKNIILMGKPGVGKTHIANAIGLEAIKQGYKVLFIHVNDLIDRLYASKADGTYQHTLKSFLMADLLILDELGFKKIPATGLDDFFEIIRRRYENGSMIITTNRSFEDWAQIFGDLVLASAIIDRVVHHAYILKITGESFRIKNYKQKNA